MRKARPHSKTRAQFRARVGEGPCGTTSLPRDAEPITCAGGAAKQLDVFVYFDNDAKVHAPFDAQRLSAQLAFK
jgi:uncharacterized protein YecE (DUF72 family)